MNNLAKIWVCEVFHSRIFRRSVSLKFIELCKEMPCWCPSKGYQDKNLDHEQIGHCER